MFINNNRKKQTWLFPSNTKGASTFQVLYLEGASTSITQKVQVPFRCFTFKNKYKRS